MKNTHHFAALLLCFAVSHAYADDAALRKHITDAAGISAFNSVTQLTFTFNVAREDKEPVSRAWTWKPGKNTVARTIGGETVTYDRGNMTDDDRKVDAQFINDSFWLLPALHLHWAGDAVTITDHGMQDLPIGEGKARMVTMAYKPESGGYTPGDAYDLFLDDKGLIVAWHFRRGGQEKPTMTTTFAAYVAAGPLQIATDHRNADGTFRLYFTDVSATTE